ncbi:MAG TPA: hypothetical protein VFE65_29070 [Pseudonocardia sp.]|jgi:hypothetical protein|nr:hypothetical protein [Pseudonocardia sp.]
MSATTRTPTGTSYRELNAVLDQARRPARTPVTPTDAQLVALQTRWATALSARLDAAIEFAGDQSLLDAVATAWRELAAAQPVLRAVLDRAQEDGDVIEAALRHELRMLALASGLAGLADPAERAVSAGRAYLELIRSGSTPLTGVSPTAA